MERKIPRLTVAEPPGHGKTTVISHHFPAYYLSKFPDHCIIAVTHTQDLAKSNGRRARNILASDEHRNLFPDIAVSDDSAAADSWETNKGGIYLGFGVGATVVGRRADAVIIDDALKGMEDADSQLVRDKLWTWYGADLLTRLKPNGVIIVVATRYNLDDLTGRLLAASKQPGGEHWYQLILPALAEKKDPLGRKEGDALWPEWMDRDSLQRIKAQPAMTARMWSALYQQRPVVEGGNILKRDWFRIWNQPSPPRCEYILQSWDTATSTRAKSAYSACITLGVFREDKTDLPSIILLSAFRKRMAYPDLRKMAQRLFNDYLDTNFDAPLGNGAVRQPDVLLVEDQSSGSSLIPDLRKAGVMATAVRPAAYGNKDQRILLASDLLENGRFWVPGLAPSFTMPKRWAEEFIISCISYPASDSRDWVDTLSQGILRIKKTGLVHNTEDPVVEEQWKDSGRTGAIY
jgi:hypothetical protein